MNRRKAIVALIAMGAAPLAAEAQPATKLPRIGVLWPTKPPPPVNPSVQRPVESLKDLGWEDGRTVAIEYRYADNDADRLARYAAELVRSNVGWSST